jgi:hypothetical protein
MTQAAPRLHHRLRQVPPYRPRERAGLEKNKPAAIIIFFEPPPFLRLHKP